MENLQRRTKPAVPENENEILDEQEQEELLQDLRQQNERSNLFIQRGIILIDILVSAIYAIFLYNTHTAKAVTYIPVPFSGGPVISYVVMPRVAAVTSILSLYISAFAFIQACRLTARDIVAFSAPPAQRGLTKLNMTVVAAAAVAGGVAPCMALISAAHWLEVGFWAVPLAVFGMNSMALSMMQQVESKLDDLDKARYKYKGA